MPQRLDIFLVEQNLAPSRTKAKALVASGSVRVNGTVATKVSAMVSKSDVVQVDQESPVLRYVSRGGLKLEGAIEAFGIDFSRAYVLDIGSSTGGFTHCALLHGAKHVWAVDVGTDCMDKTLASDPRISLFEQTDIRSAPDECFENITHVVCDASFVSLRIILPVLQRIQHPFLAMMLIKPQFECGAAVAKKYKGVITNPALRQQAMDDVLAVAQELGLVCKGVTPSPIEGGDGNVEFLTLFQRL